MNYRRRDGQVRMLHGSIYSVVWHTKCVNHIIIIPPVISSVVCTVLDNIIVAEGGSYVVSVALFDHVCVPQVARRRLGILH